MDKLTIDRARLLHASPDLLDWLESFPTLTQCWLACEDPAWLVDLATLGGVPPTDVGRAVSSCFPPLSLPEVCAAAVRRLAGIVEELLEEHRRGSPSATTIERYTAELLPALQDMNIGRSWTGVRTDGIPPAPSPDLWPFLNRANAVARLHRFISDERLHGSLGGLALVVGWLAMQAANEPTWTLPLTEEQVRELASRECESRRALSDRLRGKMALPRA